MVDINTGKMRASLNSLSAEQAVEMLLNEQIIILDTETIPGLSALPSQSVKINMLKQRDLDQPCSILISNTKQLKLTNFEKQLLSVSCGYTTIITSQKIAVRLTINENLIAILEQTGPLISTSCNIHTQPFFEDIIQAAQFFQLPFFMIQKPFRASRIISAAPFKIIRP